MTDEPQPTRSDLHEVIRAELEAIHQSLTRLVDAVFEATTAASAAPRAEVPSATPHAEAPATFGPVLRGREAAEYCGISYDDLRRFRSQGRGPLAHKLNSRVLYFRDDLDAWLLEATVPSQSSKKGGGRDHG